MDKQLINDIDTLVSEREELRRNIEACKNELNVLHHSVEKIDAAIKYLDLMSTNRNASIKNYISISCEKMYIRFLEQVPSLFDDYDNVEVKVAKSLVELYCSCAQDSIKTLQIVFEDVFKETITSVYDLIKNLNLFDDVEVKSHLEIDSDFYCDVDDLVASATEKEYKTELRIDGKKEVNIKIGKQLIQDGFKDNPWGIDWNHSKRIPRMVWKDKFVSAWVDNIVEERTEIRSDSDLVNKYMLLSGLRKNYGNCLNELLEHVDTFFKSVRKKLENHKLKLSSEIHCNDDKTAEIKQNEQRIIQINEKLSEIFNKLRQ